MQERIKALNECKAIADEEALKADSGQHANLSTDEILAVKTTAQFISGRIEKLISKELIKAMDEASDKILSMTDEEVIEAVISEGLDPEREAQKVKGIIDKVLEYFYAGKGDKTLCAAPIHCGCREKIADAIRGMK